VFVLPRKLNYQQLLVAIGEGTRELNCLVNVFGYHITDQHVLNLMMMIVSTIAARTTTTTRTTLATDDTTATLTLGSSSSEHGLSMKSYIMFTCTVTHWRNY
jgi:hypothetical protein